MELVSAAGYLGLALVGGVVAGWLAGSLAARTLQAADLNERLGPLRTALADLHDRFDHWTKRERRRAFVREKETGDGDGQVPDDAYHRALERQRRNRMMLGGRHGTVQETEESNQEGS